MPKLTALLTYFDVAFKMPDIKMYFALPGGFLTGTPITRQEYLHIIFDDEKPGAEEKIDESTSQQRFFFLKNAVLHVGARDNHFKVTVFDGLDVSAWGFYNPETSYTWSDAPPGF